MIDKDIVEIYCRNCVSLEDCMNKLEFTYGQGFTVRVPSGCKYQVKLADYGTEYLNNAMYEKFIKLMEKQQ